MILKVLSIESKNIIRNGINALTCFDSRMRIEEIFANNTFFAYSYIMESKSDSAGVGAIRGKQQSLMTFLGSSGQQLLKCRFIFVDISKKIILYDGSIQEVNELMKNLFNVKSSEINPIVELDEIKKLREITITTTANGQMKASDIDSFNPRDNDLIKDLSVDVGQVSSSTYKVSFVKEGALFKHDKLKEIVQDTNGGLRRIIVTGLDEKGTEIKLASLLSKRLVLFEDKSKWDDKINMDLNMVYEEIKKRI